MEIHKIKFILILFMLINIGLIITSGVVDDGLDDYIVAFIHFSLVSLIFYAGILVFFIEEDMYPTIPILLFITVGVNICSNIYRSTIKKNNNDVRDNKEDIYIKISINILIQLILLGYFIYKKINQKIPFSTLIKNEGIWNPFYDNYEEVFDI